MQDYRECDHQWESVEIISDEYDPLELYGHRQSIDYQLECGICGEIYVRPDEE